MTIVEFYDSDPIENAVSLLLEGAEKIIYIGYNSKQLKRVIEDYSEIASNKGVLVEFDSKTANRNDLLSITTVLESVVEAEKECVFDLSGGDDLYLVAAGIVYERNKDKVQLHRFNVRNGKLSDCDADGNILKTSFKELSLNEIIRCSGGRIIYDTEEPLTTHIWDFTPDFVSDVEVLWGLCTKNNRYWNMMISSIGQNTVYKNDDLLSIEINYNALENSLNNKGVNDNYVKEFFKKLSSCGFIKDLVITEHTLSYKYKNNDIKECLSKAGLLLELFIMIKATALKNEDGSPYYTDALTGVMIDWNDEEIEDRRPVRNEIDVLLVKGLVPVFVSCKNGEVEVDELYKLSTVANRFGGKCAKKVVVAPSIDEMGKKAEYIAERANEMGIKIIKDFDEFTDGKLNSVLKNLYC
ncbi:MAG: hypothetical protein E7522_09515 [Ruminococcaceae bacterium]|nr:hypothetical protein [Oscillospiraceae bacterium]